MQYERLFPGAEWISSQLGWIWRPQGFTGAGGAGIGNPGGGGGGGYATAGGGGAGVDFGNYCSLVTGAGGGGGGSDFVDPSVTGAVISDGVASPDAKPDGEIVITYPWSGPPPAVPEFPSIPLAFGLAVVIGAVVVGPLRRRREARSA